MKNIVYNNKRYIHIYSFKCHISSILKKLCLTGRSYTIATGSPFNQKNSSYYIYHCTSDSTSRKNRFGKSKKISYPYSKYCPSRRYSNLFTLFETNQDILFYQSRYSYIANEAKGYVIFTQSFLTLLGVK